MLSMSLVLFACKKEYDTPPINYLPEGSVITLDSLIKMYKGEKISFNEDISVYATVTMDEVDGNIYKNIYMQDTSAAINVRMLAGGGMYEGDYVRIALRGTVLNQYNGVMQLDSVDADKNLIKQAAGQSFPAAKYTIKEINDLEVALQSKLVYLDSVQFYTKDLNLTYANAVEQKSESRLLTDCNGNEIIVRTSGYANFAAEKLAQGNGNMTAIVSMFGSTVQLYIRSFDEINMPNFADRCNDGTYLPLYGKDFEDLNLTSGGWSTQVVTGTANWKISTFGNFTEISNFSGGNTASEAWYISPSMDISGATNPVLEFQNATKYNGAPMEVYISTNYTGDVTTTTWTSIPYIRSTGNFIWVSSGAIDLSSYQATPIRVAYKYTGTNSDGATWEIDDIIIREN